MILVSPCPTMVMTLPLTVDTVATLVLVERKDTGKPEVAVAEMNKRKHPKNPFSAARANEK